MGHGEQLKDLCKGVTQQGRDEAEGQKTGPGFVVIVQEKEDKDLNPGNGNEIGDGMVSSRNSRR